MLVRLEPVLRPGVEVAPKQVPELTGALLQVQGAVRGLAGRAGTIPGVVVPQAWAPLTDAGRTLVDRQVQWLRWAAAQVDASGRDDGLIGTLRRFVGTGADADAASAAAVTRVSAVVAQLVRATSASPDAVAAWAGDDGLVHRWVATSATRAVGAPGLKSLRRWLAPLEQLEPLRASGLQEACTALLRGELDADEAARAFDRGLADASLTERRRGTGLDAFDGRVHERAVARFTRASSSVRDHVTTALPEQVLASWTLAPPLRGDK